MTLKPLTKKERKEQAEAIAAGLLTEPRHLVDLPPGSYVISSSMSTSMLEKALAKEKAKLSK